MMWHQVFIRRLLVCGGFWAVALAAHGGQEYDLNRRIEPMDPFGNGTVTAQNLYERAIRLSGIVPGEQEVTMVSNRVVEREGAALGFATESAAWSNAWLSSRTTYHAHPWIDNAGWISKTTTDKDGAWSAYAYHLQNELWFRPATSVWYSPAVGVTARIARVLVGSLGDWCLPLIGEQVPFAHHLGPAWTNGPRGYLKNESVSLQPDLRTYYKILPELFWPINDGDGDGDGIPGFADGFNLDGIPGNADDQSTGDNLLPWRITIPDHLDPACVTIQLTYQASPPHEAATWLTPNNPSFNPTGPLRIWKIDAAGNRTHLAPGSYTLESLGVTDNKAILYLEPVKPAASTQASITLVASSPSCAVKNIFLGYNSYSALNLSIVSIKLNLMWETANKANQIFNPTMKDDTSTEGYQEIDSSVNATYGINREKLYLVSDAENNYELSLDLSIQPATMRRQFIIAAFKKGSKVAGSETNVPAADGSIVNMSFRDPEKAAAATDFTIKVGLDKNSNGCLEEGEPVFDLEVYKLNKNNSSRYATVFGINKAKYDWHHEKLNDIVNAWGLDDNLNGELMAIYARSFLSIFIEGETSKLLPSIQPSGRGSIEIDAFQQASSNTSCYSEWMTHNSGATLSDKGVGYIPYYTWNVLSEASVFFAKRLPLELEVISIIGGVYIETPTATGIELKKYYDRHLKGAAEVALEDKPIGSAIILPQNSDFVYFPNQHSDLFASESPSWLPATTIRVGDPDAYGGKAFVLIQQFLGDADRIDQYDAAGAIGRARLISPRYQFTVKKIERGIWPFNYIEYRVDTVRCRCALEDLYDFNYLDSELASHAASHQIAYGKGSRSYDEGKIYRNRIEIDYEYKEPFHHQNGVILPVIK